MNSFRPLLRAAVPERFRPHTGVNGFTDPNFFFALLLQFAACAFFIRDPWFGRFFFTFETNLLIALLALVIVAAFAWEDSLLGPPRGANLLLHFTLLIPFSMFLTRIFGASPARAFDSSLFGIFRERAVELGSFVGINRLTPEFLKDLFVSPLLPLAVLAVLAGCCFRRPALRFGFLFLVLAAGLVLGMRAPEGSAFDCLAAAVMLGGALLLQCSPAANAIACGKLLRELESEPDRAAYRAKLRIAAETLRRGKIDAETALRLARNEYPAASAPELRAQVAQLTGDLVTIHRLLELHGDRGGTILTPCHELGVENTLLRGVAEVPRLLFALCFALLWIVSPVDLIPDAIPFLGTLDDAAVAILAALSARGSARRG